MAKKSCHKEENDIEIDFTNGERLWVWVSANGGGGDFIVRRKMAGGEGETILSFRDATKPPYETIWPWPGDKKPASGEHGFAFVGTFLTADKYRLKVGRVRATGSRQVLKDCEFELEGTVEEDRAVDLFFVIVS
jgi:hypothetical protein